MKKLLQKYKSVIKFILTFLLVYAVLTFGYKFYLQLSTGEVYYPDYMTHIVAQQSADLLQTLGYEAHVLPHPNEASMKLMINEEYVARVIEGCNSVSVIILFMAFILAFSGQFKTTVIYILAGSVLIYVVNLFRVVILSVGLYHYPWRKDILHTVIFPAIIYGMVCLLWVVWVNRFSKIASKK
ncbi:MULTISPECIES: exosortase family protein XrtF [Bizionia]|uniref:Exosortase family protein XrtF n=1 Tax=Bizionia algoritergicola TaxID=291187 RepID=A0A5D0R434_9FLAO|nr:MULTISPECIES: exosortase family protein XrtF [Bizionia]OBX23933.1 exosortase family protein XrtF [Bizionia sp. APA-3]TYB75626.1 exosortase family protein XrtF [Bizionia algoritergicola]